MTSIVDNFRSFGEVPRRLPSPAAPAGSAPSPTAQQQLSAQDAERLGLVNEIVPRDKVLARALEFAEMLATRPQLFLRYTTVALRQRLLARLNEGTTLGMPLEGLTAADLAYQ
jgi:enoyl-CoA hydratase/carnithine racemase